MAFPHPITDNLALAQYIEPTGIPNPYWVAYSDSVGQLLGVEKSSEYLALLAGNQSHHPQHDLKPFATAYSGHQFGSWAGQLGDGRAIHLGVIKGQEIQLKGAGQTAYSRMGDGRAVLRSSIREFLCSEAMHALGVPTTRAWAVVGSDLGVRRETIETAAVCTRIAPSFLRIGHIEHYGHNDMQTELRNTFDYLIDKHYPKCQNSPHPTLKLLEVIAIENAKTVALWQSLGFCHGVLNTDNTSLLGLTMDYGPFGFLDQFDINHICNHSDHGGRYAYGRQAEVVNWNLYCLANAMLIPIKTELQLSEEDSISKIKEHLNSYAKTFETQWLNLYRQKLGLDKAIDQDESLIHELLKAMHNRRIDYTCFFRALSDGNPLGIEIPEIKNWLDRYTQRLELETSSESQRHRRMQAINPKYILRNHLAQHAIERAQEKDFSEVQKLLKILENPYQEQNVSDKYHLPPPTDLKSIEVSCSS